MRASRSALIFTYEFRGREIDGGARGLDEPMTKIVVVEEAVHVGAKDAA